MSTLETQQTAHVPATELLARPKRADACRNYDKVLAAAREAFAEGGESTSLEAIARRAGVGIGTLYRHFPSRERLVEAVYVDEVEAVCRDAAALDGADPWEALNAWVDRFMQYVATKQALLGELFKCMDSDNELFHTSRAALFSSGEPLLAGAQAAGLVRPDVDITQVVQIVAAVAKTPGEPEQVQRLVHVALDGLRYHADG